MRKVVLALFLTLGLLSACMGRHVVVHPKKVPELKKSEWNVVGEPR